MKSYPLFLTGMSISKIILDLIRDKSINKFKTTNDLYQISLNPQNKEPESYKNFESVSLFDL